MPSICAIPPEDSGDLTVNMTPGVGLLKERIVGVHFTEWNALPHMLDAMKQTQTRDGLGID